MNRETMIYGTCVFDSHGRGGRGGGVMEVGCERPTIDRSTPTTNG